MSTWIERMGRKPAERFGAFLFRLSPGEPSRRDIATRLGVSMVRLDSVLKHNAPPELSWLRGICEVLDLDPSIAGQLFEAACEELRLGELVEYTRAWNEARLCGPREVE